MEEPVGNAGKPRLFAMMIDSLLATLVPFLLAAKLPYLSSQGRGLVVVAGYLGYFFLQEGLWSRTVGKAALGLVVERLDGRRAGWWEAAVRTALRVVEVNPVLLGALPGGLAVIFSSRRQRLGDMLADTVVVKRRPTAGLPN